MQYKIPQNVQVEDKIVWPLTLRQLIIVWIWGGGTYVMYISLAKVYYIEVWIWPVAIGSLVTLAFAFLKIHDIPFLKYVLLVIEYSRNAQKRVWMQNGSIIKGLTAPVPIEKKKSGKEKIAEKTVMSLSDVSRMLDHNAFEHVQNKVEAGIDGVSDEYLLQKTFLWRDEDEIESHHDRLNQIAQWNYQNPQQESDPAEYKVVKMDDLKKGWVEVQIPKRDR